MDSLGITVAFQTPEHFLVEVSSFSEISDRYGYLGRSQIDDIGYFRIPGGRSALNSWAFVAQHKIPLRVPVDALIGEHSISIAGV